MTRAEGAWRQAAGGIPSALDPLTAPARCRRGAGPPRGGHAERGALERRPGALLAVSSPRSGRRSTPGSPRPAESLQGLSAGSAASGSRAGRRRSAAYDRFLSTNESLGSSIQTQRDAARIDSREATTITSGVIIAVAAAVVLVLVAAGFGMDRAVGRPLARLREVVRRQAEEDVIAMANQEEGALEVRMLARDFNDLTRANARLVDQQAAVLEMQELVLDVGRARPLGRRRPRGAPARHDQARRRSRRRPRAALHPRRGRPDHRGPPPVAHRRPARPAAAAAVARPAGRVPSTTSCVATPASSTSATSWRTRPTTTSGPAPSTGRPAPASLLMLPVGTGRPRPRHPVGDDGRRAATLAPPRDPGRAAVRRHRRPVDRGAAARRRCRTSRCVGSPSSTGRRPTSWRPSATSCAPR